MKDNNKPCIELRYKNTGCKDRLDEGGGGGLRIADEDKNLIRTVIGQ